MEARTQFLKSYKDDPIVLERIVTINQKTRDKASSQNNYVTSRNPLILKSREVHITFTRPLTMLLIDVRALQCLQKPNELSDLSFSCWNFQHDPDYYWILRGSGVGVVVVCKCFGYLVLLALWNWYSEAFYVVSLCCECGKYAFGMSFSMWYNLYT